MRRSLIALLLALCALLAATACSDRQGGDSRPADDSSQPEGGGLQTAAILFDFSGGSAEEDLRTETHYSYSDITDEEIIEVMSDLSGLDFFVDISVEDGRYVVDWAADSTLIAGLDERPQKEDFFFYDADSMRWFMMDSLWRTLGKEELYYTMDGGRELAFDALYPVSVFPADMPYRGSGFYFAQAGAGGDFDIDAAAALVREAIDRQGQTAPIIASTGEEEIGGELCWTFSAGDNSTDGQKFTAMYHYAVSRSGGVYYVDILQGSDWIALSGDDIVLDEDAIRQLTAFADAFFGGMEGEPELMGESAESVLCLFTVAGGETVGVELGRGGQMFYLDLSADGGPASYRIVFGNDIYLEDGDGKVITAAEFQAR